MGRHVEASLAQGVHGEQNGAERTLGVRPHSCAVHLPVLEPETRMIRVLAGQSGGVEIDNQRQSPGQNIGIHRRLDSFKNLPLQTPQPQSEVVPPVLPLYRPHIQKHALRREDPIRKRSGRRHIPHSFGRCADE